MPESNYELIKKLAWEIRRLTESTNRAAWELSGDIIVLAGDGDEIWEQHHQMAEGTLKSVSRIS